MWVNDRISQLIQSKHDLKRLAVVLTQEESCAKNSYRKARVWSAYFTVSYFPSSKYGISHYNQTYQWVTSQILPLWRLRARICSGINIETKILNLLFLAFSVECQIYNFWSKSWLNKRVKCNSFPTFCLLKRTVRKSIFYIFDG